MGLPDSARVRVLLVDDHELVRTGLALILARWGMEVVGEAGTEAEAVAAAERLRPDVVVMDVRLADGSGVHACREIRSAQPDTRILFLTAFDDEDAMLATVFASADGYVLKEIGGDNLVHAIRAVTSGLSVLSPASLKQTANHLNDPSGVGDKLSPQERRVLALVAQGRTNKEIGAALSLSPKTVKNYLHRVFQKLQVVRRSQAAALFRRVDSAARS